MMSESGVVYNNKTKNSTGSNTEPCGTPNMLVGGRLPLTDCAMAERGVFVKDAAKLSVEISDGCDGLGKILFKGVSVNFTDRA